MNDDQKPAPGSFGTARVNGGQARHRGFVNHLGEFIYWNDDVEPKTSDIAYTYAGFEHSTASIDDTVRDVVQHENPGSLVTGWVLTVEVAMPEHSNATGFVHSGPGGQTISTSRGLVEEARDFYRSRRGDLAP